MKRLLPAISAFLFIALFISLLFGTASAQSDPRVSISSSAKGVSSSANKRVDNMSRALEKTGGDESSGRQPSAVVNTRRQRSRNQETSAAISGSLKLDASGPLPTVDQVLDKYVEALGGRDALLKFTSRVAKGRVEVVGVSRGGSFETYAKAPNKSVTTINLPSLGVIKQGFNGASGWDQTAQTGLRAVTGEELMTLERDSDFYSPLRLKVKYPKMMLLGKGRIGYRETYVIKAIPAIGDAELLHFDKGTGLVIRRDVIRVTSEGKALAEVYLDEWREVDGVKMSFRISQSFPGFTLVLMFDEVKHNVAIDDAVFNRPATK